jgi:NADH dehydrogenase
MQQARFVSKIIERRAAGKEPDGEFHYFDKGIMATIGRSRAVAQTGKLRLTGFVAWLTWLVVHIWYLIGFRNRLVVMINWAVSYVLYKRGARLITGHHAWERALALAANAEHVQNGAARVPEPEHTEPKAGAPASRPKAEPMEPRSGSPSRPAAKPN